MPQKFFVFVILIVIYTTLEAQDYNKVYYNSDWVITSFDKAEYYRTSEFDTAIPSYRNSVKDYFYLNNQIEMTGYYEKGLKEGEFKFYYSNGIVKSVFHYSKGQRVGLWEEYYENGKLKTRVQYNEDFEKILDLNDVEGNSIIIKDIFHLKLLLYNVPDFPEDMKNLKEDDLYEITGCVLDNFRDGKWVIKKNNNSYATLKYSMGVLKEGYYFNNNQKKEIIINSPFPLIVEPMKFFITEKFFLEPDAIIINNYVTEGLYRNKLSRRDKIEIQNYENLVSFINENFIYYSSSKAKELIIHIQVVDGMVAGFWTDPLIEMKLQEDLRLILSIIKKINFVENEEISIIYSFDQEKE